MLPVIVRMAQNDGLTYRIRSGTNDLATQRRRAEYLSFAETKSKAHTRDRNRLEVRDVDFVAVTITMASYFEAAWPWLGVIVCICLVCPSTKRFDISMQRAF